MAVTTALTGPDSGTGSALADTPGGANDPGQPYRELFEHMREGLAYCQMIFEEGEGCDFVYLDVNGAFETLTGLKIWLGSQHRDYCTHAGHRV